MAAGATLLATGEIWRIVRHYDWPVWVFWLLLVVMLGAAVLNTAVQMISDTRTRQAGAAEPATAAEQRLGKINSSPPSSTSTSPWANSRELAEFHHSQTSRHDVASSRLAARWRTRS